jgi:hypothetical protein
MTDDDVLVVKRMVRRAGFDHIDPTRRDQGGLGPPAVPLLDAQPRLLLMADEALAGIPANANFPPEVIDRVHQMAETGQYPIRGLGARRKLPTFDDLVFLTASVSRYPLEGYRERCETNRCSVPARGKPSSSTSPSPSPA